MLTRTFLVTTECSTDNHADVILEAVDRHFPEGATLLLPKTVRSLWSIIGLWQGAREGSAILIVHGQSETRDSVADFVAEVNFYNSQDCCAVTEIGAVTDFPSHREASKEGI